jgi:hypothetical protein
MKLPFSGWRGSVMVISEPEHVACKPQPSSALFTAPVSTCLGRAEPDTPAAGGWTRQAWPVSKRLIFPPATVNAQRVRMSPQVSLW